MSLRRPQVIGDVGKDKGEPPGFKIGPFLEVRQRRPHGIGNVGKDQASGGSHSSLQYPSRLAVVVSAISRREIALAILGLGRSPARYLLTASEAALALASTTKLSHMPATAWPGTAQIIRNLPALLAMKVKVCGLALLVTPAM